MPRFYAMVGYAVSEETAPGVWEDHIIERPYYGDLIRNVRRFENKSQLNDNVRISNNFSIVADEYAYANFHTIRYITYMGTKWKVESVDASQPPRLVLEAGEVYNE